METSNSHSQYRMAAEPVNGFGRPRQWSLPGARPVVAG